jgi:SAM-dependent methyltransferase
MRDACEIRRFCRSGMMRDFTAAARRRLPGFRSLLAPAFPPPTSGWRPRNERETCVCGIPRRDIPNSIWVRPDPSPVNARYYYRCECGTFSAVNLFFNEASYHQVPIAAYSIPDEKKLLNRARIEWIRARIPTDFPETAIVYDLGSGEGCFTGCWREAYPHSRVFAIEGDARMEERFAVEYAGAEFVCERIETFLEQAGQEAADLVVLCDVLEHVVEPERLLRLIAGALKPSGFAYITVPNAESYGRLPQPIPSAEIEWDIANEPAQHLWMIEPRLLNDLVNRTCAIWEMSRSFEFQWRGDSDYSTFLVRASPPRSP